MITDAILKLVLTVLQWAWGLVPTWSIAVPSQIDGLVSELSKWNKLVPFSELMSIASLVGSLFLAQVGFKVVVKVIDWITNVIP